MKKVIEKQQRRSSMAEGPKQPPHPPPGVVRSWQEASDSRHSSSRPPLTRRRQQARGKSVSEDECEEEVSDERFELKSRFGKPRMVSRCSARSVAARSRSRSRTYSPRKTARAVPVSSCVPRRPRSQSTEFGQPRMVSGGGKRPSPRVRGSREACAAAYQVTEESASESGEDSSGQPSQKLARRGADIPEGRSSSSKAGRLEKMFDLRFEPGAEACLEKFYEIAEHNTARNLEKGKYSVADLRFRARSRARDPDASSSAPGDTVAQSWLVTVCPEKADTEFLVCQMCFSGWEVA